MKATRGIFLLAALLLPSVSSTGSAQAQAPAPTPVPALSLDHVGIQAADLGRSVRFYTEVLGLRELPAPFPKDAARWLSLGNGRMLHIVGRGRSGAPRNRWDHFALACADLDALIARLDALHVSWSDMEGRQAVQTRPDRVRQIFVQDPNGYTIEINDAGSPK